MHVRPNLIRIAALVAAAALPAAVVAVTPAAQAANPNLGYMTVSPASGNQGSDMLFSTKSGAFCPAGTTQILLYMTGSEVSTGSSTMTADNPGIIVGLNDYPQYVKANNVQVPAAFTAESVFGEAGVTRPSGQIDFHLECQDTNMVVLGEFKLGTVWTPTGQSKQGTYVSQPGGEQTATALATDPVDPISEGTATQLTATVTPPSATGSIEFRRGSTVLATVPVASGSATTTTSLPAGTNDLVAAFVPTGDFAPSQATVPYVVAGAATVTGTAQTGGTLTCTIAAGATISYTWLDNGAPAAGFTGKDAVVPAAWVGHNVGCKATVTKNGKSVSQTSATKTVALGTLASTAKPKVKGTFKMGKKLKTTNGTWSAPADSYKYQWLRNGKPIKKATKSAYKLVAKDKGKKISVKVTAVKAGYTNGIAKSAAKKVT